MAKRTKRKTKKAFAPPQVPLPVEALVIDRLGPTKVRTIKKSKIVPSVFSLDDGTRLLVRPRIGDVRRAIDQYNHDGAPLYFLSIGHAIETKAPKHLYRKIKKIKSTK